MKKILLVALSLFLVASCSKKSDLKDDSADRTSLGYGIGGSDAGLAGDLRTINFDYDQFSLTAVTKNTLMANAEWLKVNPAITIQVEGHCDGRGTIEYNIALGERRAAAVKAYLVGLGIEKSRVSTVSYGKERPLVNEETEYAWAQNRRANFVVIN